MCMCVCVCVWVGGVCMYVCMCINVLLQVEDLISEEEFLQRAPENLTQPTVSAVDGDDKKIQSSRTNTTNSSPAHDKSIKI